MQEETSEKLEPDGHATLPEPLYDNFLARSCPVPVKCGENIFIQGGEDRDVFLIRSGKFQVALALDNGRELILSEMGPGCIFGEMSALDGWARAARVHACEDGELARMEPRDFERFLVEMPEAGLWLSRQLAARVRVLSEKVFELFTMPVAGRLQAEILRLAAVVPAQDDRVLIARMPTHAELATRIGSHREAVSRELAQLARENLLRQTGRSLEILSLSGLKAIHARFRK